MLYLIKHKHDSKQTNSNFNEIYVSSTLSKRLSKVLYSVQVKSESFILFLSYFTNSFSFLLSILSFLYKKLKLSKKLYPIGQDV